MDSKKPNVVKIIAQTKEFIINRRVFEKHENYFSAICRMSEHDTIFKEVTKAGEIVIDCPADIFQIIINYLTTGKCSYKKEQKEILLYYAHYYCINTLILYVHNCLTQCKDIPDEYFEIYKKDVLHRKELQQMRKSDPCDGSVDYNEMDKKVLINLYFKYKDHIPMLNSYYKSSDKCILHYKHVVSKKPFNTPKQFITRFCGHATSNLFGDLSDEESNNIFIAGGAILNCLTNEYNSRINDIDIFIYGLNEEQATKKIEWLIEKICRFNINKDSRSHNRVIYRTADSITIEVGSVWNCPRYQIIYSRLYKCKSEILLGFDIDCCGCGYDFKNVYVLEKTLFSLIHRINIAGIDKSRFSNSYENRLCKYAKRGFSVYIPGLDWENLKYMDNIPPHEKRGLCKLLYIDTHRKTYEKYEDGSIHRTGYSESNYDRIKVPDNTYALDFFNKIVSNPTLNLREQVLPVVWIRFEKKNIDAYKNIIEFDKINLEYTDAEKPIHDQIANKFVLYRNLTYYPPNPHSDDADNLALLVSQIEEFKLQLFNINKERADAIEPYPDDKKEFEFVYPHHHYHDTALKRVYRIKTNLKPYLEFKKDDPGKQIITGTYAEKYDFWDQAYKSWRSYQLDMSTMAELFE